MAKLRNQEIKKLWKLGKTLQDIADEFGVSKQRIHQIVFNTKNNNHFSKKIKEAILKRDNYKCLKCGDKIRSHLTINHIIPRVVGGGNKTENLETLCSKCNRQAFAELTRKAIKFYFEVNKPNYRKSISVKEARNLTAPRREKYTSKKIKDEKYNLIIKAVKDGFYYFEIGEMFKMTDARICQIIKSSEEADQEK